MAKFGQTRDREIWGNYVTKIAIFGFWAIFGGLVRASETIFLKNEKNVRGYSSRVPKKPHMAKFGQTRDRKIWGNYVTKITCFSPIIPQKWPKNAF